MNLKETIQSRTGNVRLQWNCSDVTANRFMIFITTPVHAGSELFTTSNTSIYLPVIYNQDYDVSVVASNCAGNSTPAEISFRIGKYLISRLLLIGTPLLEN